MKALRTVGSAMLIALFLATVTLIWLMPVQPVGATLIESTEIALPLWRLVKGVDGKRWRQRATGVA